MGLSRVEFAAVADNLSMTPGYDPEFFMRAAGVIEFYRLCANLTRWSVAWCDPAVGHKAHRSDPQFGMIDAIGHTLIIVTLLAIVADNRANGSNLKLILMPAAHATALVAFLTVYYAYPTRRSSAPPPFPDTGRPNR